MKEINCNLCGVDDWTIRFPATMQNGEKLEADIFRCTSPGYGNHAQIVTCNRCGYVYANPRWSSDDLLDAYEAVEDETYLKEREGRELTFERHLRAMEKYTGVANGRSLLDVGAYIGVFVEIATKAGWDAWGIEPSEWAAKLAQKEGIQVIQGTQDSPELAGKQFDVVTMWDVIEHVADPAAELAKAYALLKPGGMIAVHTMDIDSLMARVMGARWPWLMDMHIHYFSQRTLGEMMKQKGFEIVWSGAQARYLRLGYVATRVEAFNEPIGRLFSMGIDGLKLGKRPISLNFGDLFTVYGKKPE